MTAPLRESSDPFIGNENEEIERQYIRELMAYKIEGLIILSHTIPSRELADLKVPIVTIEREDTYVSSVNTDNYMGGIQAVSLLAKHGCDVLIHINTPTPESVPAYGRIRGFEDFCRDHQLPHEIFLRNLGQHYEEDQRTLQEILSILEEKYQGKKKGIFVTNDTHANTLLNLLIRRYGKLPPDYYIIGFDNSPVSQEAVFPISTIGQQIDKISHEAVRLLVEQMNEQKKRKPAPLTEPVHKVIAPVLLRRYTTERE